jgi:hypothetical protein
MGNLDSVVVYVDDDGIIHEEDAGLLRCAAVNNEQSARISTGTATMMIMMNMIFNRSLLLRVGKRSSQRGPRRRGRCSKSSFSSSSSMLGIAA